MTSEDRPDGGAGGPEDDPGANTEMFRAFVEGDRRVEPEVGETSRTGFRVLSLLVGLGVFVALAWLLLRA